MNERAPVGSRSFSTSRAGKMESTKASKKKLLISTDRIRDSRLWDAGMNERA